MTGAEIIAIASKLLGVATDAVPLLIRAIQAANDDDLEAAERYLAEARGNYASSRDAWDNA